MNLVSAVKNHFSEVLLIFLLGLLGSLGLLGFSAWKHVHIPYPTDIYTPLRSVLSQLQAQNVQMPQNQPLVFHHKPFTVTLVPQSTPMGPALVGNVAPIDATEKQVFIPREKLEFILSKDTKGIWRVVFERLSKSGH